MASRLPNPVSIAFTPTSLPRENSLTAYASGREVGDGGQQPVHFGLVVVVDQPGADPAAGFAQAQGTGQFPGVVVAVPHVDLPAGQPGRDLTGRVPGHGEER